MSDVDNNPQMINVHSHYKISQAACIGCLKEKAKEWCDVIYAHQENFPLHIQKNCEDHSRPGMERPIVNIIRSRRFVSHTFHLRV